MLTRDELRENHFSHIPKEFSVDFNRRLKIQSEITQLLYDCCWEKFLQLENELSSVVQKYKEHTYDG